MTEDLPSAYRRHERGGEAFTEARAKVDSSSSKSFQEDSAVTLDGMKVDTLQQRMQEMRQSAVDNLNDRLNDMMSEIMQRLRVNTAQNGFQKESADNSKKRRSGKLVDKEFMARNSFLTDLFEINHIRTIYNIFVVMLFILFLDTAVHDYLETGTTHVGIKTIRLGFGKFFTAVQIWILMTLSCFAAYIGFSIWANKRINLAPKSFSVKILDLGFFLAFIAHEIAFIILPAKYLVEENVPPASSMMILMEQVRMLMKRYAFVRSTTPRILAQKVKNEDEVKSNCPDFSKFLYFMFAPTLVYRDEYPRAKHIRWNVVMWNFSEVMLIVFYTAFIFERFLIPPFEKFGSQIFVPRAVILTIFSTILPGLIMFLFGFYCILHSWQNGMAELLRFADKLFYKDWWNCRSYDAYYRTWNIIVHDWLYTYIYKDIVEKLHNKVLGTLTVFLVSAAFHEYILAFSFRFFYPVLLLLFGGFGMFFVFITRNYSKMDGNLFIWFTLFMGNGVLFTLYSMEYYARSNCPPYSDQFWDLLLPRSWICHLASNNSTMR